MNASLLCVSIIKIVWRLSSVCYNYWSSVNFLELENFIQLARLDLAKVCRPVDLEPFLILGILFLLRNPSS